MLATTLQAAHFCGMPASGVDGGAQVESASAGSTLCLTCLMAQSLAAGLFFVILFLAQRRRSVARLQPILAGSILDSFPLFDRPPPAF